MYKFIKNLKILILNIIVLSFNIFAYGQQDPRDKNIAYLNLNNVNVRDAISGLFQNTDISYSIDGAIQGSITIRLENQPFETVLRNILNQIGATYRVQDGIYEIVAKSKPVAPSFNPQMSIEQTTEGEGIRRIPIRSADPALIVKLLSMGFAGDWKSGPEVSLLTMTGGAIAEGGFSSGFGGSNFKAGIQNRISNSE